MTVIFASINFRLATVNGLWAYAKNFSETHSDTLDATIHFFEHNKVHPFGELTTDLTGLEINIKRCINFLIVIIKDIEKHKTKKVIGKAVRSVRIVIGY